MKYLLGFPITDKEVSEVFITLQNSAQNRANFKNVTSKSIHFLNAYCITQAHENQKLEQIYKNENVINFVDGFSLQFVGKLLYGMNITRLRGTDFLDKLFRLNSRMELRIGILGGNDKNLSSIMSNLELNYPKANICLALPLPYVEIEFYLIDEMVKILEINKIDVCLIAIGTPKQDFLSSILAQKTNIDFACIGAGLEFISGIKRESPKWVSKIGFEWLFRLMIEPKRLWRRYIFGIPHFLKIVLLNYICRKDRSHE